MYIGNGEICNKFKYLHSSFIGGQDAGSVQVCKVLVQNYLFVPPLKGLLAVFVDQKLAYVISKQRSL